MSLTAVALRSVGASGGSDGSVYSTVSLGRREAVPYSLDRICTPPPLEPGGDGGTIIQPLLFEGLIDQDSRLLVTSTS